MGSDGGKFDVSDRLTADRLNRKTVLVETGANIALAATTPGMLAFCTSSGSGFVAGQMYQRNENDTAWYTVIYGSAGQTLTNKVLNVDENSVKHTATNVSGDILKNNGTKYDRLARGSARQVLQVNATGSDAVWGLISGGSVASDFRRPDTTIGTLSAGSAGAVNTNWSGAIGQVSHNVRNTGNKILVVVTGRVRNQAQNSAQRSFLYSIFVDGAEETGVTRTHQTATWMTSGAYDNAFCIFLVKTGLSSGSHTFDLRVRNSVNSSDGNMTAEEVLVTVTEFGGAD